MRSSNTRKPPSRGPLGLPIGLLAVILSSGLLAATPGVLQDAPAALVVEIEGDVQLEVGGATRAAAVGTRLSPGDRVIPAQGARATLLRQTGQTQVVEEPVTIQSLASGESGDQFSRAVGVLARAATSDAATRTNRQGMIRPVPGQPVLVSPRNGVLTQDPRPTFVWLGVEGGTSYTIQIRKEGSQPVRFEVGADTTWTYPAEAPPLLPGATYHWTVASQSRRVAQPDSFRMISGEAFGVVAQNLNGIAELGLDPYGSGLLLTTVVFLDTGLLYDALSAVRSLEQSAEVLSVEALLLKAEILAGLGRFDEADAVWAEADRRRGG